MIGPAVPPVLSTWHSAMEWLAHVDRLTGVRSAVHDGDTIAMLMLTEGSSGQAVISWLRVFGVNAPELEVDRQPNPAGIAAKVYAETWLSEHRAHAQDPVFPWRVQLVSQDKYGGRLDAIIVCGLNHCLNDALIESGNAQPYGPPSQKLSLPALFGARG